MKRFKMAMIAGFAMFSMFFGSGNLVFPLTLGAQTLELHNYAAWGLMVTGIIVPFLGLISVVAYQGNRHAFFGTLGPWAPSFFSLIILSLIGPFGVVPRCVIVAFGGIHLLWSDLEPWMFSLIFCGLTAALVWQRHAIVDIIGKWLTPIKLGSILVLVIAGLIFANPVVTEASGFTPVSSFKLGITMGYQTMDLLAAFFFSVTIVRYLKRHLGDSEEIPALIKTSLGASLIGAIILTIVYLGFVRLGAWYGPQLQGLNPENYLVAIAGYALGPIAKPLVAVILFFACLTTATILTVLFAEFVTHDLTKDKLPRELSIILTLIITFAISLLGFGKIAVILEVILGFFYPALIVLALSNLIDKLFKTQTVRWAFGVTCALCALYYVYIYGFSPTIS